MMGLGVGGDGSLVYQYLDTVHLFSQHRNDDGISDDGSIGVSTCDGRGVFRSQETIHSFYINRGAYCHGCQSGADVIGGYMYQETSHLFSPNCGSSFYGD